MCVCVCERGKRVCEEGGCKGRQYVGEEFMGADSV